MGEVVSGIPGWTAILAARREPTDIDAFEAADFRADMAELDILQERIFTALASARNPIRPAAPGEIHRDAFLATRTDLVGNLGLAADLGLQNPWPWDYVGPRIKAWRNEIKERVA